MCFLGWRLIIFGFLFFFALILPRNDFRWTNVLLAGFLLYGYYYCRRGFRGELRNSVNTVLSILHGCQCLVIFLLARVLLGYFCVLAFGGKVKDSMDTSSSILDDCCLVIVSSSVIVLWANLFSFDAVEGKVKNSAETVPSTLHGHTLTGFGRSVIHYYCTLLERWVSFLMCNFIFLALLARFMDKGFFISSCFACFFLLVRYYFPSRRSWSNT